MGRQKLFRKSDWERLDRVLNYKTIAGAGLGYFYGLLFSGTLVPLIGKLGTAAIGIPLTFALVLFWDYVEQGKEAVEESAT